MAYISTHTLVTFTGTSWTGMESWTFGIRFSGNPVRTQAMADAAAAAGKTWITTASSGYVGKDKLTSVKVAPIGPDGKYPPGLDSLESFPTAASGTYATGVVHPPQIALVVSLTTAMPRGNAHIGRVYLPGPAFGLPTATSPTISSTDATNVLTNFRTLVLSLNAIGFGSATVMSKKWGQQNTVTGLRCGLAYDTMRSRRRSVPENPVSLAL